MFRRSVSPDVCHIPQNESADSHLPHDFFMLSIVHLPINQHPVAAASTHSVISRSELQTNRTVFRKSHLLAVLSGHSLTDDKSIEQQTNRESEKKSLHYKPPSSGCFRRRC